MKDKKPFKDTKLAGFLRDNVAPHIPDIMEVVGQAPGLGIIGKIGEKINAAKGNSAEAAALAQQWDLRKLEFEGEMRALDLEFYKADMANIDSARNAEIQLKGGNREWLQPTLALAAVAGFFATLFYLLQKGFKDMSVEESFIIGSLLTACLSRYGDVYGYYFGSSAGSRANSEAIRKIAAK